MNHMLRTLITTIAFAAVAAGLPAQPALKIVTVDMAKIFDSHFTTQEKMAQLGDAEKKAQEDLEAMNKERAALAEQYKEALDKSKNTLLTADARTGAEQDAPKKLEEIQRKQSEMQAFFQNVRSSLQQRRTSFQSLLLEEISKKVTEIAKRKGATLVVDRTGPSLLGIPPVIYADAAYDMTEDVIAEINKDRPATPAGTTPAAPTPPAATTPAPSTTAPTASTPAPTITVPTTPKK